jgi:hypothetical protein
MPCCFPGYESISAWLAEKTGLLCAQIIYKTDAAYINAYLRSLPIEVDMLGLAYWLVNAMMALKPPLDIPLSTELHIDYRVLLFTAAVSVLTGVVFGRLPALQATNPDLVPALKDETTTAATEATRQRREARGIHHRRGGG